MTSGFEVRIVSGARKHGISRSAIETALSAHYAAETIATQTGDPKVRFVGRDGRGREIEVIAVVLPRMLLIIHAMPTYYLRKQS